MDGRTGGDADSSRRETAEASPHPATSPTALCHAMRRSDSRSLHADSRAGELTHRGRGQGGRRDAQPIHDQGEVAPAIRAVGIALTHRGQDHDDDRRQITRLQLRSHHPRLDGTS